MRTLRGRTFPTPLALTAALFVCATAWSPRAEAQRQLQLTPFVGAYLPTATLAERQSVEIRERTGLALGVRALLPAAAPLAVEGVVGYVSHALEGATGGAESEGGARLLLAGARGIFPIGAARGPIALHGSAGVALLARGGDAFDNVDGTTDVAAVIGVGAHFRVRERATLRADLEDYISSASFSVAGRDTDSRLLNDFMLTIGVVVPLGAR